jgi:hypothetical protein
VALKHQKSINQIKKKIKVELPPLPDNFQQLKKNL